MNKTINDNTRNLLFDLGGVIMDIRRENCVKALTDLGMEGADEMLGLYCQSGPFLLLEEGKMSAEAFRKEIRSRCTTNPSDDEIDTLFVVKDAGGKLVSVNQGRTRSWSSMWSTYNGRTGTELDLPSMPQTAGSYTVDIYFAGAYVTTYAFTVTAE